MSKDSKKYNSLGISIISWTFLWAFLQPTNRTLFWWNILLLCQMTCSFYELSTSWHHPSMLQVKSKKKVWLITIIVFTVIIIVIITISNLFSVELTITFKNNVKPDRVNDCLTVVQPMLESIYWNITRPLDFPDWLILCFR